MIYSARLGRGFAAVPNRLPGEPCLRFYGLGQAFCEPVRVKRRLIAMNGPRGSGDFARDND